MFLIKIVSENKVLLIFFYKKIVLINFLMRFIDGEDISQLKKIRMQNLLLLAHHFLLLLLELLLGHFLLLRHILSGLCWCNFLLLGERQFDVAWRRHVWINATVSTICAASQAWSAIDLNVIDDQHVGVQSLVVSISFGVLQELEKEVGRFFGPATD